MPAVEFDAFFPHVKFEVPRAPSSVLRQQLREAAREFLDFTRAWQVSSNSNSISAGVPDYEVEVPMDDATVVAVEMVQVNGAFATPKTSEWLDQNFPAWRTNVADDFRYYVQQSVGTILFASIPSNNQLGVFNYRASFKPTPDATEIDEGIYNQWYEPIADAAKARLLSMDGQPWANAKRAAICQARYLAARGRAKIKVSKEFGNVQQQWTPKYRFGGR